MANPDRTSPAPTRRGTEQNTQPEPVQPSCHEVVLGFDCGTRRIGVAVGQTISRTATPLTTVQVCRNKPDWLHIMALVGEWQPHRLLVGLPLNMRLEVQHMTKVALRFARQLQGRCHLPTTTVDECLSTQQARSRLPGKRHVDAVAAMLIIETWFTQPVPGDRNAHGPTGPNRLPLALRVQDFPEGSG